MFREHVLVVQSFLIHSVYQFISVLCLFCWKIEPDIQLISLILYHSLIFLSLFYFSNEAVEGWFTFKYSDKVEHGLSDNSDKNIFQHQH